MIQAPKPLSAADWAATKALLSMIVQRQIDEDRLLWSDEQKLEYSLNLELEAI